MKKITIVLFIALAFFACKKDQVIEPNPNQPNVPEDTTAVDPVVVTAPKINTFTDTEFFPTADNYNSMDLFFNIEWNSALYDDSTNFNYTVQLSTTANNFTSSTIIGTTIENKVRLNYENFNVILIDEMGLPADQESEVKIRVAATRPGLDTLFSDTVTLTARPYPIAAPSKFYVINDLQGYRPDIAPFIREIADKKYEGYFYTPAANAVKFTDAPDYNHKIYGQWGIPGTLTDLIDFQGPIPLAAGFYKINVNLNLAPCPYSIVEVNFGIIGTSTPGGSTPTAMTYNATEGVWEITANLTVGDLRFKGTSTPDITYGPTNSSSLTGTLTDTPNGINIATAGNYTIKLDFKQTTDKYYRYSVVKN